MKKYKPVYVEWVDSVATVAAWLSKDEALEWGKDSGNYKISQIGFVMKKTKKYLLLASRISPEQVGGVFKIPIKCVTKITSLMI
jgi:hypothetical protein